WLQNRWLNVCAKTGLVDISDDKKVDAFLKHSLDVKFNCSTSDYLAKFDDKANWGVDREIAKASSKNGKKNGMHPFELAFQGYSQLFIEYTEAIKGKAQLFWSRDLKKKVGIVDISDEEISEEDKKEEDTVIGFLRKIEDWKTVTAYELRSKILDMVEDGFDIIAIRRYIADYEQNAVIMFAILRTKRIKDNVAVGKTLAHNLRSKYNQNVDKSRSNQNEILIDELCFQNANDDEGYSGILEKYYQSAGAKQKDNSVKAMEFVLTASPAFFENAKAKDIQEWKKAQIEFAKKEFGENLKFAVLHLDEKTPHLHLIVSVEEKKTVKFKNRYGSGEKEQISLNARRFNREYLKSLQTRYAEHNEKFGLSRGLRNSKATHRTLKTFYKNVDVANNKNYESSIRKIISKKLLEKKNMFGYIKTDDALNIVAPILNDVFKKLKAFKTLSNFNSIENIAELEKVLNDKQSIEKLRKEYFDAVKNYSSIKKENEELKARIEKYEQKPKLDKNHKNRIGKATKRGFEQSEKAPLGSIAKSTSPCPSVDTVISAIRTARSKRFELLSSVRSIYLAEGTRQGLELPTKYHRTTLCKHAVTGSEVLLMKGKNPETNKPRGYFTGLQTCGSVWTCPICANRIQEQRRGEIAQAMKFLCAEAQGKQAVMITFTFPHTVSDKLKELLEKFSKSLMTFKSGKAFVGFKNKYGFEGLIRSLEITRG
ncbi:hypothetical protein NECAME_18058, partial [Necator americanus]